jgi:hypothetical protein
MSDVSGPYSHGRQPCAVFQENKLNRPMTCPSCQRLVQWCGRCLRTHHAGGWQTCPAARTKMTVALFATKQGDQADVDFPPARAAMRLHRRVLTWDEDRILVEVDATYSACPSLERRQPRTPNMQLYPTLSPRRRRPVRLWTPTACLSSRTGSRGQTRLLAEARLSSWIDGIVMRYRRRPMQSMCAVRQEDPTYGLL